MTEDEYMQEVRRALNLAAKALEEEPARRRVFLLDAAFRFLHAHERYTGAVTGTAAIWKPLILAYVETLTIAEDTAPLRVLVRCIEQRYGLKPSLTERGVRY